MRIGLAAKTRIWLQQKTTTKNSVGQMVETWTDTVKVSAEREEESGSERIEANRVDAQQVVRWKVMTTKEVDTDWRIRTGGTEDSPSGIQNIRSVQVTRIAPREIEILAEKQ